MRRLTTKPIKWHVRLTKTQISLGICPVWSESSLCTEWVAKDPRFLQRMPRLIWIFGGRTLILLVLTCRGSHIDPKQKPESKYSVCCIKERRVYGKYKFIRAATWQNQQSDSRAPSEDSDRPGHPPRLIWVFAGRTGTLLVLSCPGS